MRHFVLLSIVGLLNGHSLDIVIIRAGSPQTSCSSILSCVLFPSIFVRWATHHTTSLKKRMCQSFLPLATSGDVLILGNEESALRDKKQKKGIERKEEEEMERGRNTLERFVDI